MGFLRDTFGTIKVSVDQRSIELIKKNGDITKLSFESGVIPQISHYNFFHGYKTPKESSPAPLRPVTPEM